MVPCAILNEVSVRQGENWRSNELIAAGGASVAKPLGFVRYEQQTLDTGLSPHEKQKLNNYDWTNIRILQ